MSDSPPRPAAPATATQAPSAARRRQPPRRRPRLRHSRRRHRSRSPRRSRCCDSGFAHVAQTRAFDSADSSSAAFRAPPFASPGAGVTGDAALASPAGGRRATAHAGDGPPRRRCYHLRWCGLVLLACWRVVACWLRLWLFGYASCAEHVASPTRFLLRNQPTAGLATIILVALSVPLFFLPVYDFIHNLESGPMGLRRRRRSGEKTSRGERAPTTDGGRGS